jgi:cell division protein FtsL
MKARSIRNFKETLEMRSQLFKRLQRHRYFPIALIVTVLLAAACLHVWQRVMVIGLVKEVSQLQKENRRLVDDTQKVQSEIASLCMSARIEQYAVDSLGMRPVPVDHLYTLIPEASRSVPSDELATMLSSIKRVARYLPVLTETQAGAAELKPIKFEPELEQGETE